MPGRGTPRRVIRVSDALWDEFGKAVERAGVDRTAALREFMLWYASYPGAHLPARPEPPAGQ